MKYTPGLLLVLFIGLLFCSCSNSNESSDINKQRTFLSGTIDGGENKQLFINRINSQAKGEIIDTITLGENGAFTHEVNSPLRLDYYVITAKNRKQFYLVTDSTESVKIEASYSSLNSPSSITGSQHTTIYQAIFKKVDQHRLSLENLNNEIMAAGSIDEKKSIAKGKKALQEQFRNEMSDFFKKNSSSPGLAAFFDAMDFTKEPSLSAEVINNLAKSVPYSNYYKAIEKHVKQLNNPNVKQAQRPDIGKVAPNIELKDPNGKEITLYELRGNVVLVDFWASWCGPCRRENPNVVKAYNKYHDAGFEVLSVSLDSNREKWVKAIEEDGLIWDTHVSDLLKWKTPYTKKYGFTGIPHAVLVSRDGTIIQSKIRGVQLEEQLEAIFGY